MNCLEQYIFCPINIIVKLMIYFLRKLIHGLVLIRTYFCVNIMRRQMVELEIGLSVSVQPALLDIHSNRFTCRNWYKWCIKYEKRTGVPVSKKLVNEKVIGNKFEHFELVDTNYPHWYWYTLLFFGIVNACILPIFYWIHWLSLHYF